jgi:protein-disulfide isomerase-like protein with CxxC motif
VSEPVRFVFDPICPWCWVTSAWVRRLETLGEVDASWGLFSLEIANRGRDDLAGKGHGKSALALRTCVAVRDAAGDDALGTFYAALGERVHGRAEPLAEQATVEAALADAGLDAALAGVAADDPETLRRVAAEHEALVERTRSFGVPTIMLDGGEGPAIFGPVIGHVPDDADAVALWRHVSWLARYDNFSELKRDRTVKPDHLASWQARRRAAPPPDPQTRRRAPA